MPLTPSTNEGYTQLVRPRLLALILPVLGAAFLVRCAIYDGSLLLSAPAEGGSPSEAGTEAGLADARVDADTCAHAHAPPPPTTEDGSGNMDMVLAASFIRILPKGTISAQHPVLPQGLDLDDTCTCPAPESCKPPSATPHCDGDGGTDDSTGDLFEGFAALSSEFTDEKLNANVTSGGATVLFRIRNYNGGPNDKKVTVVVYSSRGLPNNPDGGDITPLRNGTDVWTVDPSSLLGGTSVDGGASCEGNDNVCIPVYADADAYVTGGTLVAHLDFPITVGGAGNQIVLNISASTLFARLIPEGASFRIDDGQVAGRWNTGGMLTALGKASDPLVAGGTLCNNAPLYQNVKARVCAAADIMTRPTDDNSGKGCNALSIGVSFTASPGHLGPIYSKPAAPDPCDAGWKDDCP
jgi:hypothetical protein